MRGLRLHIPQAFTLGSAFYGIYFIVSYPLFFSLDEPPEFSPDATDRAATATAPPAGPAGLAPPAAGTRAAKVRAAAATAASPGAAPAGEGAEGGPSFRPHTLSSTVWEALGAGMLVSATRGQRGASSSCHIRK